MVRPRAWGMTGFVTLEAVEFPANGGWRPLGLIVTLALAAASGVFVEILLSRLNRELPTSVACQTSCEDARIQRRSQRAMVKAPYIKLGSPLIRTISIYAYNHYRMRLKLLPLSFRGIFEVSDTVEPANKGP